MFVTAVRHRANYYFSLFLTAMRHRALCMTNALMCVHDIVTDSAGGVATKQFRE